MATIRDAGPLDYQHYARLFPELAVDDPVPPREKWDAELQGSTLVAERGGEVAGVCFFQLLDSSAYVRQLMVSPEARRHGVGRALLDAVRERVLARGGRRWCLNVKPDNLPAVRLYEAVGMRLEYRSVSLKVPWAVVKVLPTSKVKGREVTPADDEPVEQAFTLPKGQLADGRRRGRVLRWLCGAAGEPKGLAVFDPDFPGAYPFRVRDVRDARALFEALEPSARPQHDHLGVVAEDDPELVSLLTGFGARVRLEFVHFEGAL
jgi:GNAT superfamily N-acetyltransferase